MVGSNLPIDSSHISQVKINRFGNDGFGTPNSPLNLKNCNTYESLLYNLKEYFKNNNGTQYVDISFTDPQGKEYTLKAYEMANKQGGEFVSAINTSSNADGIDGWELTGGVRVLGKKEDIDNLLKHLNNGDCLKIEKDSAGNLKRIFNDRLSVVKENGVFKLFYDGNLLDDVKVQLLDSDQGLSPQDMVFKLLSGLAKDIPTKDLISKFDGYAEYYVKTTPLKEVIQALKTNQDNITLKALLVAALNKLDPGIEKLKEAGLTNANLEELGLRSKKADQNEFEKNIKTTINTLLKKYNIDQFSLEELVFHNALLSDMKSTSDILKDLLTQAQTNPQECLRKISEVFKNAPKTTPQKQIDCLMDIYKQALNNLESKIKTNTEARKAFIEYTLKISPKNLDQETLTNMGVSKEDLDKIGNNPELIVMLVENKQGDFLPCVLVKGKEPNTYYILSENGLLKPPIVSKNPQEAVQNVLFQNGAYQVHWLDNQDKLKSNKQFSTQILEGLQEATPYLPIISFLALGPVGLTLSLIFQDRIDDAVILDQERITYNNIFKSYTFQNQQEKNVALDVVWQGLSPDAQAKILVNYPGLAKTGKNPLSGLDIIPVIIDTGKETITTFMIGNSKDGYFNLFDVQCMENENKLASDNKLPIYKGKNKDEVVNRYAASTPYYAATKIVYQRDDKSLNALTGRTVSEQVKVVAQVVGTVAMAAAAVIAIAVAIVGTGGAMAVPAALLLPLMVTGVSIQLGTLLYDTNKAIQSGTFDQKMANRMISELTLTALMLATMGAGAIARGALSLSNSAKLIIAISNVMVQTGTQIYTSIDTVTTLTNPNASAQDKLAAGFQLAFMTFLFALGMSDDVKLIGQITKENAAIATLLKNSGLAGKTGNDLRVAILKKLGTEVDYSDPVAVKKAFSNIAKDMEMSPKTTKLSNNGNVSHAYYGNVSTNNQVALTDKALKTLDDFYNNPLFKKQEVAILLDPKSGKYIEIGTGNSNSVKIGDISNKQYDGWVLVHNHPEGGGATLADLATAEGKPVIDYNSKTGQITVNYADKSFAAAYAKKFGSISKQLFESSNIKINYSRKELEDIKTKLQAKLKVLKEKGSLKNYYDALIKINDRNEIILSGPKQSITPLLKELKSMGVDIEALIRKTSLDSSNGYASLKLTNKDVENIEMSISDDSVMEKAEEPEPILFSEKDFIYMSSGGSANPLKLITVAEARQKLKSIEPGKLAEIDKMSPEQVITAYVKETRSGWDTSKILVTTDNLADKILLQRWQEVFGN